MLKSSSTSYIENFKSDIFNQKPSKKECKYRRIAHGPSLERTSNDIFSLKTEPSFTPLKRGIRTYSSQTDIFFTKPSLEKPHYDPATRNVSNKSSIFEHHNNQDYIVMKPKIKTNYNPDNYYPDETPTERHHKEFHNNCKFKKFRYKNQKGYYEKEDSKLNNSQHVPELTTPIKKRFNWNNKNSTDYAFIKDINENVPLSLNDKKVKTAKTNRLMDLQSNIFNQPEKPVHINVNRKENGIKNLYEGAGTETDNNIINRNWKVVHSKWPKTKMEWIKTNTELMFKKYDDKKEEEKTAFDRKINEFSGETKDSIFPKTESKSTSTRSSLYKIEKKDITPMIDDNSKDIQRIHNIVSLTSSMKKDKEKKYMENVSSIGFDKDFYLRNMKCKTGHDDVEHEYQLKPLNNSNIIDDYSIKKLLFKEGIHAYGITPINDGMNKDSLITFKVRDNDSKNFKEHFESVKEKLKKSIEVEIEPIHKIRVIKRKDGNEENIRWEDKQVYPDKDLRQPKYIKVKGCNKERLSDQFWNINNKYKNEGLNCLVAKKINK